MSVDPLFADSLLGRRVPLYWWQIVIIPLYPYSPSSKTQPNLALGIDITMQKFYSMATENIPSSLLE